MLRNALRRADGSVLTLVSQSTEDCTGKEYDQDADYEPEGQLVEDHSLGFEYRIF